MDAKRWERMQELFHAALDLSVGERREFLEAACKGDEQLLQEVVALLEEDEGNTSFLEPDLAQVAREVLDGSVPVLRKVGPYRIREVLGQGGMGVVYLAERDDLHSRAAIKVLRDATLSPSRRERFTREQQMLAQLTHPAIARLYDADVLPDGTPYFVMEYVDGMPLTEYCRTHECDLGERLTLFSEVCEAVQYAHRQAVIHRDLKPSNIFVCEGPDGKPSIKLLDFGIAKQLDEMATSATQTQTGLRLMTPAYAAPEQIRGEQVGLYTDVYALGVVLYELLTGQRPFDLAGLSPGQIEAEILERNPEKPSTRARHGDAGKVPLSSAGARAREELDVLCLTAMHKDPQRRYATVEALQRDLDHYGEGRPLEARPDSARYRAAKFLRRNRQPVVAALLVWVVVTGLVAYYTLRVAEQRDRAQAEAAKAEQVSEYLIGLFEAGDPFEEDADSVEVRTLLQRGIERVEELEGQPEVQAHVLDVLGRVYSVRGDYDLAAQLVRRALTLRRDTPADPLDLAESLGNLGRLYSYVGQRDSAEVYLRRALALREQHLPPRDPDFATNLQDLGTVLVEQGEYQEAEVLYRLALRIRREAEPGPHEELSHILSNLGVTYFNQGRLAAAEQYYTEALEVERALHEPDHPKIALSLSNLAGVYRGRKEYGAADSLYTEALRIQRAKLGDDHYYTISTLTAVGALKRGTGDYEAAARYLRDAAEASERVLGPHHPHTATSLNQLALTLTDLGRLDAAEPILRRVIQTFDATVGDRHYYTGASRCQLAHVLHRQGQTAEAEPLYREGLAILRSVMGPGHPTTILHEGRLGTLLAEQSRYEEAEPLFLSSYEALADQHGQDHAETRRAAQRLVELYRAWDKPNRAGEYEFAVAAAE